MSAMVLLFFMLIVGPEPLRVRVANAQSPYGNPIRQIFYLVMVGALLIGAQPYLNPRRLLVLNWSMLAFLLWAFASTFWSDFQAMSVRRFWLTAMLIWAIFRIVDELGYARTIGLWRQILVAALVLNFIAVATSPVAIHQFGERADPNLVGDWRGFLEHKNYAGEICAMTLFLFLFGGGQWRWPLRALVLAAAIFFLWKTGSKTSMNMALVGIVAGWVFSRYNPAYRMLLVSGICIIGSVLSLVLVLQWDHMVAPLYSPDPSTLTGRVVIWPVLLAYFDDHAWLGAGFGAFWVVGPNGPVFRYDDSWVTALGNGHNGYLDMLVTLGIPGLVLAVLAAFVMPMLRLLSNRYLTRGSGALLMAIIVFFVGHNLTETTLMDRDAIGQICLMLALALERKITSRRRPLAGARGRAKGMMAERRVSTAQEGNMG